MTKVQPIIQDDPKLLDGGGGEIPKSQGRGWWFNFPACEISSLLDINLPDGHLPHVLWL